MKKIITLCLTVALVFTLGACGQEKSSSSNGNSSSAKSIQPVSESQSSENSSSQQNATLWNNKKDEELADFMRNWGPTMGQDYQKYDGHNPLHVSVGLNYPADLSRESVQGGGSIGWAPSGKGDYDYNVVAIYNFDGNKPPLPNRITYFFAFHDGQPVALVDQTRDGDPTCHPTVNKDVSSNFTRIADQH
jgi:hypothetical protein